MGRPSNASKNIISDSQQAIYKAAIKLFARNGYAETKTQEIARNAKVSKAMLHYYYETKENLFRTVIREGLSMFEDAVQKSMLPLRCTEGTIKVFLKTYFTNLSSNPEISRIIFRETMGGGETAENEIKKHFVGSFHRLAEILDPSKELTHHDPVFLAYSLFGMATMFIAGHFTVGREIDPEKLSGDITSLFLNGARAK